MTRGAIAAGHEERKVQLGRQDHSQDLEADGVVMVGADSEGSLSFNIRLQCETAASREEPGNSRVPL